MNSKSFCEIMATAGPTMESIETISKAICAGVSSFRLPIGLRSRDTTQYFYNIREASKICKNDVEVCIDLPSSRPRISDMEEFDLFEGKEILIYDPVGDDIGNRSIEKAPLPGLTDFIDKLSKDKRITFRDGSICFTIEEVYHTYIKVICQYAKKPLKPLSSSSFPDSAIEYRPILSEDIEILKKMASKGLTPDWIIISFTSSKDQIDAVKKTIKNIWESPIQIMAKIETQQGVENINEILNNCDGIMVGRGDLAGNIEPYKLPKYQEYLVSKAHEANKVAVVGTEIMECMAETGIVNRAELSDMYLLKQQKVNAAMLSRETGNSAYAFNCINLMKQIFNS